MTPYAQSDAIKGMAYFRRLYLRTHLPAWNQVYRDCRARAMKPVVLPVVNRELALRIAA